MRRLVVTLSLGLLIPVAAVAQDKKADEKKPDVKKDEKKADAKKAAS